LLLNVHLMTLNTTDSRASSDSYVKKDEYFPTHFKYKKLLRDRPCISTVQATVSH
jgi:hypothetical protein